MAHKGNLLRDAVVEYINSWGAPVEVLKEVNIGYRFVNTPRRLDIAIHNKLNDKCMAIECKLQLTDGTAYEKFSYALEDCINSPIPTILVFAGDPIKNDMKSKLVMSGRGIEVEFQEKDGKIVDKENLLKQRCYIELGLNWFPFATGEHMQEQLQNLE